MATTCLYHLIRKIMTENFVFKTNYSVEKKRKKKLAPPRPGPRPPTIHEQNLSLSLKDNSNLRRQSLYFILIKLPKRIYNFEKKILCVERGKRNHSYLRSLSHSQNPNSARKASTSIPTWTLSERSVRPIVVPNSRRRVSSRFVL